MAKGLRAEIFTTAIFKGCSNGGVSSRCNTVTVTGPGVPELFEPTIDAPEVRLMTGNLGTGYKLVPAKEGKGAGPMFGGAFVYSSDSRFPGGEPIKLHDRWESWEDHKILSR